jgi:hypothetical protein
MLLAHMLRGSKIAFTGATFDGQEIEGADSIKTEGCRHQGVSAACKRHAAPQHATISSPRLTPLGTPSL